MASRGDDKEDDKKDDGTFLFQYLRREFVKPPKEYHRGQNIEEYITSVSEYCDAMGAREAVCAARLQCKFKKCGLDHSHVDSTEQDKNYGSDSSTRTHENQAD